MQIDKTRFLLLTSTLAAMMWNCSDDHPANEGAAAADHSSPYAACDAIIKACHPYDVGEGPLHDCHNVAHEAKSEAPCLPEKDRCVKLCEDATLDGGAPEAG